MARIVGTDLGTINSVVAVDAAIQGAVLARFDPSGPERTRSVSFPH